MEIREAIKPDAKALALVNRAARDKAMPWLPVLHTMVGDEWFFANRVIGVDQVLVAQSGDQCAGFIAWQGDWLNHLYIHPEYWRQGIGHDLMLRAQAVSQQLNLWVFLRNADAQRFYKAHGFEAMDTTDGASNEEKTPDMRMLWTA